MRAFKIINILFFNKNLADRDGNLPLKYMPIRNSNGTVMSVKISSICYLLNNFVDRVSADRVRRFFVTKDNLFIPENEDIIKIGEWGIFQQGHTDVAVQIFQFSFEGTTKKDRKFKDQNFSISKDYPRKVLAVGNQYLVLSNNKIELVKDSMVIYMTSLKKVIPSPKYLGGAFYIEI